MCLFVECRGVRVRVYSTTADVYSFRVVLWELLTWQVHNLLQGQSGGGRWGRDVSLWGDRG
jgi:hypothetical protein